LRAQNPRDGNYTLRAQGRPRIFSQTNDAVAIALRGLIVDLVPPDQDLLIDAYCGAGFFAKALLDRFERVVGIDWDRFAIAEAQKTASPKETYVAADVERVHAAVSAAFTFARETPAITMIVDPPATGLSAGVRKAIVNLAPTKLIYVSCNPSTLARDVKELGKTFALDSVTPLDMFPQTAEIEVVVSLTIS
jgi:23S rRNA (uracil1939-C5)-methyltransferase